MSYRAKLILENAGDTEAALSAYPEPVPGLPVTNLQLQERSYVMRSTSGAAQAVYGNLSAPRTVASDGAALFGDFSAEATVRIRLYSGANQGGTVVYDSTALAVSPRGKSWFDFFTGAGSYLSFRIDLADPAPPAGYHEIARLVLGPVFSPAINIDYGYEHAIEDDTGQERDAGGGIHSDPGPMYSSFKFKFSHLSDAERASLHTALLWAGKTHDVFIAMRPEHDDAYDFAMLAKFTAMPNIRQPYFGHYSAPFELSETAGGYAGTVVALPGSGGGGLGINSEWRLVIDGQAALTSSQPIASNWAGVAVIAYQGRTMMRTADHGMTWLPVVISACPSRITDVRWSGNYFLACGDSGDIYHSLDGATWTAEANTGDGAMGLRFDAVFPWDDGIYAVAGEELWIGEVGAAFYDDSGASGWSLLNNPVCAAIVRTGAASGLAFPAYQGGLVFQYSSGVWSYWTATGIAGNWVRAFASWSGRVLAVTDANQIYRSDDGGHVFYSVYTPPSGYLIHDAVVIAGPSLVLSMAGPGGDRMLALTYTAQPGSFTEYRISAPVRSSQFSRLAWTGRRAIITDAGAVRVSGAI